MDLPVAGAVGQIQDELPFALNIAAERDHMKPERLAARLVDVFAVPFDLLAGEEARQPAQNMDGLARPGRLLDHMDVLVHLRLRNAQQLFDVRADVVHPQPPGVQHQKHIVHVDREPGEQLVAHEQLMILALELLPVQLHHKQQKRDDQDDGDGRHHEHGRGLEPVHAGVNHIGGYDAQHHPVLKVRRLVHHVVVSAADVKQDLAGAAAQEVLLHGGDVLAGQPFGFFQQRKDIADILAALAAVVHDDPAVVQRRKGAGLSVEGGDFERLHHVGVVEGDGDGLIGKAPVAVRRGGHGKHHDLRLVRDDGVGDHRVLFKDQIRELLPQVQIAPLSLQREVIAVAGDEVEIGEVAFLPGLVHIGHDIRFAFGGFQIGRPHPHAAPVDGNQIVQGLVRLVEDLDEVIDALLVDRPGDEVGIVAQAFPDQHAGQHEGKDQGHQALFHGVVFLSGFIAPEEWSHTAWAPAAA